MLNYVHILNIILGATLTVSTMHQSSVATVMHRALPHNTQVHTQHVTSPSTSAQSGPSSQGLNRGMAKASKRSLEENDRYLIEIVGITSLEKNDILTPEHGLQ